ncbi:MAG: tyrosine-type recombinase/integrase [Pseudomonadota bacterium]
MKINDITDFIELCRVQRGLSDHSLRAYRQDLNAFHRFWRASTMPEESTSDTIISFITFLRDDQKLNPSTVRRRLVTLRGYFNWLKGTQRLPASPFDGLILELRAPRRLPRPVDRPTLSHLFRGCRRMLGPSVDPTSSNAPYTIDSTQVTSLVARTLVSTGLRIGEITRVRIADVSSGGTCIRVRGKGNRERSVYVGNERLLQDLNAYLSHRRQHADPRDFLFLNSRGGRLTEPAFRKRLRTISADLSIAPHLTPHRFRHSAATMLIEEGVDIRLVQRLLGHASIATTEIYTKVSDTSLISAIQAADTLSKVDS